MSEEKYSIIDYQKIQRLVNENWISTVHPSLVKSRNNNKFSFFDFANYEGPNDIIMAHTLSATKYDLSKIDDTYSDGFNVLAFCYWWLTGEKEDGVYDFGYCDKVDTLFDALATLGLIPEGNYLIRISW